MLIAVNATAISPGGGLTILSQFLKSASLTEHSFLCFVPSDIVLTEYANIKFVPVRVKSWFRRIFWDSYGLKRFLSKNSIVVDKFISLQNTSVNLDVKQIIYLHQPVPFVSRKLISKCNSLSLYAYFFFYKFFIFMYVRSDTVFVVQTEWMYHELLKCNVADEQVFVIKPNVIIPILSTCDISNGNHSGQLNSSFDLVPKLIYPSSTVSYKNHLIILEAIKIILDDNKGLVFTFQVTFSKGDYAEFDNFVDANFLHDYIDYLGFISPDELHAKYMHSHALLFPSYIESYGLPLVESALLGKKILASNLPYAQDVMKGYKGVDFVCFDDVQAWASAILSIVTNPKCHFPAFTYENELGWADFFELIEK